MSLLDVMGERALRGAAGARHLYAKLHRALVTLNNTKVVIVPPKPSNGRVQVSAPPAVAAAPTAPPVAEAPGPAPVAVTLAAAPPLAPPAVPAPQPSSRPEPAAPPGTVVRRSSPVFSPPSSAESASGFPLQPGSRDAGKVVIAERGASGARLHEARRLNRIALFGVAVGILNLIGLIVAIAFAGSMLRAVAITAQSADETVKIDRRAWVGLASTRLGQPYTKTRLGMTFVLENTGKTPAAVDGIDVTVAGVDSGSNRHFKISSYSAGAGSIAPGASESLAVFEPKPLSDAGFAALANRRVHHEFAIVVRYRDVFGDAHRTDICKAIEGSAAAMTFADSLPSCSPNTMD